MSRFSQLLLLCAGLFGPAVFARGAEDRPDPGFLVPEVRRFTHTRAKVSAVAVSPDGKLLAARDHDRRLLLWDRATGKELTLPGAGQGGVNAFALSPDGKVLATAHEDGTVRLWDLAARRETRRLTGHKAAAVSVAFAPDGNTLASGGGASAEGLTTPDGKTVTKEHEDKTLRLWDVATGKELRRWDGFRGAVTAVAFSPDGKRLACVAADFDDRIVLHDLGSGRKVAECLGPQGWIAFPAFSSVAFAADGKTLVSAGTYYRRLELWDAATGKRLRDLSDPRHKSATLLALAPDGRTLASASWLTNQIVLWDTRSWLPRAYCAGHTEAVTALAFAGDGRTLVSAADDGTVRAWDAAGLPPDKGARPDALSGKQLRSAWEGLADARPDYAYRFARALIAEPRAVAFLRERLRPVAVRPDEIERLVADLDGDDFPTRDRAARELEGLGTAAEPALRRALADKPSAEVRRQAGRLLELVREPADTPPMRRALRAVEVLERVGTPDARVILAELGKNSHEALLAREAKAALGRLGARP